MKKQKGFTLIELLIVLVIIGILVAIVAPKISEKMQSNNNATYTIPVPIEQGLNN